MPLNKHSEQNNSSSIHAAKDPEAIKDCIRRNEHVAITLYRDFAPAAVNTQPSTFNHLTQDRLPLRVVNH